MMVTKPFILLYYVFFYINILFFVVAVTVKPFQVSPVKLVDYLGVKLFIFSAFLIAAPVNAIDLSERLSGKILLQVEKNGEGWYLNPENNKRYFLGRPADAFRIMRELGLGVSESTYNSFSGYAPSRLSGKILLRVEANGEAYYVFPDDLKLYFLGRPADAFQVMREKGLGITNNDLGGIDISGESSLPSDKPTETKVDETTTTNTTNNNPTTSPSAADIETSRYYKNQIIDIIEKAKANHVALADYAQDCINVASKRIKDVESLSSDRNTFLPSLAFDSFLYKLFTTLYNLYDAHIAVMNEKIDVCSGYKNALNDDINKLNNKISSYLVSDQTFTAELSQSWFNNWFIDFDYNKNKNLISSYIDGIYKSIDETNASFQMAFDGAQNYITKVTTPTSQPTYYNSYIPPAPAIPQMPKTTYCSLRSGIPGQMTMSCETY